MSPRPAPANAPPSEFRAWDFSYSVSESKRRDQNVMRFRDPDTGAAYFCTSIARGSEVVILDSLDSNSHWDIRCALTLHPDGTAVTTVPDAVNVPVPDGTPFPATRLRMCAVTTQNPERLAHPEGWWRARCERTGASTYVAGYRGKLRWVWDDGGPHVHADDMAGVRDAENVLWFQHAL